MKKLIYTLAILALAVSLNAQWVQQTNPLSNVLVGKIQFVSATEGWISLGNGKLLHTINGGNNWLVVTPEPVDSLFGWSDPALNMSFINANTGWIIRTKGSQTVWNGAVVYKTTNGGVSWTKVTIPVADAGMYIQFTDANNGWILIFNANLIGGGMFRTTNGGVNWNAIYPPVGGFPFFINSNTGWLMPISPGGSGTTSDTIRKTTNGGVNWTAPWGTNAQVNLNAIHFSDINNGWAVGKNGIILKTSNSGNSWTVYTYYVGMPFGYGFNCKSVFFLNANKGWITTKQDGTSNVNVLYTNNGGSNWTWQAVATGGSSIFNIHFFDAMNGGLTSENLILHTTNGGGVGVITISSEIPSTYSLGQNYPNPFNPTTKIKFDVARTGDVKIVVYDVMGREVQALVNESLKPGTYEASFDASALNSGVYFYKLITDSYTETKKLLLIK